MAQSGDEATLDQGAAKAVPSAQIAGGTALTSTLYACNPIATPLTDGARWLRLEKRGPKKRTPEQIAADEHVAEWRDLDREGKKTEALSALTKAVMAAPKHPEYQTKFIDHVLANNLIVHELDQINILANSVENGPEPINITTAIASANISRYFGGEIVYNGELDITGLSDAHFRLTIALLRYGRVVHLPGERVLTKARRLVLDHVDAARVSGEPVGDRLAALAEAFALHSFENEYLWDETAQERETVDRLEQHLHERLSQGAPVPAAVLFTVAAYRPLEKDLLVRQWVAQQAQMGAVDETLRQLVLNRMIEEQLALRVPSLTDIDDGVSAAVRAQYEENPYPRWRRAPELVGYTRVQYLRLLLRGDKSRIPEDAVTAPAILVAGCGTGQVAISMAKTFKNSSVVGVDLSRASLAYGARMANENGVRNVTFAHADLLKLEGLEDRFDIVDASGVLHHMSDTEEGLRALLRTLKPGGYGHIAVYSERARQDVVASRKVVADLGFKTNLEGLRAFRNYFLASMRKECPEMPQWRDFYAASELRDLVFHVQEHRLTLPQLRGMIDRAGVEFLGFKLHPTSLADAYATMFPEDPDQTNLSNWEIFEDQKPSTFASMYSFWIRKPA